MSSSTCNDKQKLKQQYLDYAAERGIVFSNDDELYRNCNTFHQNHLLDGWFVEEGCPHRYDGDCDGWYVGNKRCVCGNYKGWSWNEDDFDPDDVKYFNINSTSPVGYAERMW